MKISKIILPAFVLLSVATASAQPISGNNVRPETMLQIAEERREQKDVVNAADWYERYYQETDDKTVAFDAAVQYMKLRDYAKAESWFARVLKRDKKSGALNLEALYYYAQMLKINEKYDEAIASFEEFIAAEKDEARKAAAQKELQGAKMAMTMKENVKMTVESMGNKVNSQESEYTPVVSPDGKTLYFGSMRRAEATALDGKEGDYHSKIFAVSKDKRDAWGEPEALGGEINRPGAHQGNVALSKNGKVMYFTRFAVDKGVDVGESKIYYAEKQGDSWGAAAEVKGVNGNYLAKQPALGELYGKEVLFFAANMPDTKGGFDIYYATKQDNGSFSTPINLGSIINTVGDDETPFYKDSKLYFSSTGHVNIGGFDMYSSAWNGSTWSNPENLGKPLNSAQNDQSYFSDDDGNIFFVSNRTGTRSLRSKNCCQDIFTVKAEPLVLKLLVTATEGGKKLSGLTYKFTDTKATDEKTADKYEAELAKDKSYSVIVSKKGYYSDTIKFNTTGLRQSQTIEKVANLRPIPIPPVILAEVKARTESNGKALTGVNYTLVETGGKTDARLADTYGAKLNLNKTYMLTASKKGYRDTSVAFDTKDLVESVVIEKVLELKPKMRIITNSQPIVLPNIYYKLGKAKANEIEMDNFVEAQRSLNYLYDIMVKNPTVVIEVSSHTDSRGSDASNLALSQRRADGIRDYLVAKGIAAERIVPKGYGETALVNQCTNGAKCTEDEHLQNRRSEFKIISGPTSIEITEEVLDNN